MLQFNKNAKQYDLIRKKITYPETLYKKLSFLCKNNDFALDIGCGNGVSTVRLTPYFNKVEGIDIGSELINYARTSYPEINFKVGKAEEASSVNKYNLITSATSFYWMDREKVLNNLKNILAPNGIFCAYKYDFPLLYGNLRNFINYELSNKWAKYRDKRLISYDDTLEIIEKTKFFNQCEAFILPNTLELTAEDIANFFLSTSYVNKYIEVNNDINYPNWFISQCNLMAENTIKVNFDIYCYLGY